jgi:hypothetical protein
MKTFLFIAIFGITLSFSQTIEWEHEYPNYLTLGKALTVDADNNIVAVGNGFSQAAYNEYLYVEKLSPLGNTIWKDSISTNLANNYHAATWVGVDTNNDIFIVGYRYLLSNQNEVPNALKVIKFSSDGTLLQNKTIPGVFNRDGNFNLGRRNESTLDENGNLYVASAGATDTQNGAGFVLLKFDANATLLWEKLHSFSNIHGLRGMHYNNGKIALVGTTTVDGTDNKVAVWDQQGTLLWASTNGIPNQSWATDVLLDPDGNTYTLCQNYGTAQNLIELTKYSPSGTVLFSEQFGIQVAATSGRMALLPNGNLAITGTNWTSTGDGTLFVAQLSSQNGTIIQSSTHALPQINNWVYDVWAPSSGNYYVAGQSDNNGGAPSTMFLFAFSTDNGYEWDTTYTALGTKPMNIATDTNENIYAQINTINSVVKFSNSLLATPDVESAHNFTYYPNPIDTMVTLEVMLDDPETVHLTLYDTLGHQVLEIPSQHFNQGRNTLNIDLSALASGTYYCTLTSAGKTQTAKLIKL